jgi:amino acid transporter
MLQVIPLVLIMAGFLLYFLSEKDEKPFMYLFLAFIMIPASFAACAQIAIESGNASLQGLMEGLYIVFAGISIALLAFTLIGRLEELIKKL